MRKRGLKHNGRFAQTGIYLGKFFRMFIFQNDWKVLPMAAIIAGLIAMTVGTNLYKNMEGTLTGSFALACLCVWNGFFNSIQVICRERPIVKREHRSGLHISSYIAAHMIYQAFICLCQAIITIAVNIMTGVTFPEKSLITPWSMVDIGISIFLITYSADMLALMISAFVRTTTAAMTIMPFLLIIQLIFSGGFFNLSGTAMKLTDYTVTKWGLTALCTQGNYNSLPMVSLWNNMVKMKDFEYEGEKPILDVLRYAEESGKRDEMLVWSGENNQNPAYVYTMENVLNSWKYLIVFSLIYVLIAVVCLEFIDKDKR